MSVHEVAAEGFGKEASTYEASRPSYPPDAVSWIVETLRLRPQQVVCDLAAGTGILTRLLLSSGADIVAVEPVEGMRAVLREKLPAVPVASGVAEALPFRDASLDAVTIAQAFHWFDAPCALAELRRVVRIGGGVVLLWNARDRSEPWVNEVWSIMDRVEKRAPWRDHEGAARRDQEARHDELLDGATGFGPLQRAQFWHRQALTPEGVVARVQGVSHVAVLPPDEQGAVLDEVRAVLAAHPDTHGRARLEIPYRVDCYSLRRLP